jgi:cobyrinic acid a,c-diamide synthase
MMDGRGPSRGLVLAAPNSGSGKTVLTLALLRALKDRGIAIRAAKAGPDFIDPGFHGVSCGLPSVNLDPWAMGANRLRGLARAQGGTHLLIEAMMGLFDGAADGSGSAADLAVTLGASVVLVVDAARQSHSVAALVRGFRDHRPGLNFAGVILNKTGGARHETMLKDALDQIGVRVFGCMPRSGDLVLPERHLGLVQASEHHAMDEFVVNAAKSAASHIDIDGLIQAFEVLIQDEFPMSRLPPPGQRVAIARDAAFTFAYTHQLDDWRAQGAELMFFSPLANEAAPENADAIYLSGGYPELHAGQLSAANRFREGLVRAAARGVFVYGECGGYMVLGEGLEGADGERHAMAGLLKLETSFARRRLHLGYRRASAGQGFPLGQMLTAHEFHYSSAITEEGEPLFTASDALGAELGRQGLRNGSVMGSYLHVIDAA